MNTRCRTRNTFTCTRIISLTALGASASGAFAEVITVDDDGKADFASIQAAVDYASAGDEILIAPGVYTSDHPAHVVDLLGKAITLRSSDGPGVTIIDGEGLRRGIACFNGETAKPAKPPKPPKPSSRASRSETVKLSPTTTMKAARSTPTRTMGVVSTPSKARRP